jgi:hypothetical protein
MKTTTASGPAYHRAPSAPAHAETCSGVAPQGVHPFLNPSAAGVVQAHNGNAELERQIHDLADLPCAGQVSVEISRSGGAAGAATVNVLLQDHTTTPPDTSFVSPQTVAFADGEVSKMIAVGIVNDPIREGEEHFTLHLESASPGSFVGTQSQTSVDILDNDDPGTIGFLADAASVHEGAATLSLIVRRMGGTQGAVTVEFSGVDGTALAGSDYSVTPGTLRWEDGHWGDRTITVTIFADAAPEGSETFDVVLSNPTGGAALGTASVRVTVTE